MVTKEPAGKFYKGNWAWGIGHWALGKKNYLAPPAPAASPASPAPPVPLTLSWGRLSAIQLGILTHRRARIHRR
jgi:hypothetical protein